MVRMIFFVLYGMAIGAAYAFLLSHLWGLDLLEGCLYLMVVFALAGWHASNAEELTNIQRLGLLLLFPVVIAAAFVGLVTILGFGLVAIPFGIVRRVQSERTLHRQMKAQRRFTTLRELQPRLIAGEGTLIEETGNKGPYHVWWTSDNLDSLGKPVSTNHEFMDILLGKGGHAFNTQCLREYLDVESGKAILTSIPLRKLTSGELLRRFPNVPIAKVVRPMFEPSANRIDKPVS